MSEIEETIQKTIEQVSASHLQSAVAVLVALTATFMAICNVKDGNIVQAMDQAQAKSIDTWAYYQAKSIKQHLAQQMLELSRLQLTVEENLSAAARQMLTDSVTRYESEVKKYQNEKEDLQNKARGYQAEYDRLNQHDDQFDMANTCLSIALALYGITALTRKTWLLGFSVCLSAVGIALGLAGFFGWSLHPNWLATLLS